MKNRLKFVFSYNSDGCFVMTYNRNKRVDNIRFPMGFLQFEEKLIICKG